MIKTEKTVDYLDFPEDLQRILRTDYIDGGSSNGSYSYIVIEETKEENKCPVINFLYENGAKLDDEIILKVSW